MAFVDEVTIFVKAGDGGDGCASLRREKFVPKGGPDGGDGGRGGHVIFLVDPSQNTLHHLARQPHNRAGKGGNGSGKSKTGAAGRDCIIQIPPGTVIKDHTTGDTIADLVNNDEQFIIAQGGGGGFGNEHFKSATNQTPRNFTPGTKGEEKTLRLQLKLLADVGIIGLPNAGKSTMLAAISRARPKVADYPFTTLWPGLGMAELTGERRLILADIPGLIEGASGGAGLGHDFLRHIERTTVLLHLLDVSPVDNSNPAANYRAIRDEMRSYSPELAAKPEIIVLNKIDLVPASDRESTAKEVTTKLNVPHGTCVVSASGATGDGLNAMLEACWEVVYSHRPNEDPRHSGWKTAAQR